MSDVETIVARARSLGLTLCVEGDRIAISPARQCPPDLLTEFQEHKPAVMALLAGTSHAGLRRDEIPWLYIARQILAGEFNGADGSTRESLAIGLRSIRHPLCERALAQLKPATSKQKGSQ
jgi:hypothetical protein